MQMFADVGAIISGRHFVNTSGRHSSVYINKDALYLDTRVISALCLRTIGDNSKSSSRFALLSTEAPCSLLLDRAWRFSGNV
jgi:orotate phosphoribosyltransferase